MTALNAVPAQQHKLPYRAEAHRGQCTVLPDKSVPMAMLLLDSRRRSQRTRFRESLTLIVKTGRCIWGTTPKPYSLAPKMQVQASSNRIGVPHTSLWGFK